jgi:hypothetical protein
MSKKSLLAAAFCAAAIAGASASAAFAGEVTGNGKDTAAPEHAGSICAFSGQNDNPDEAGPDGGRTQSFGQLVKKDVIDPRQFNPGDACNPNAEPEE